MSGFYLHFRACIGVTLPRMLLVHPGFPGAFALPWLQPVCPGLALGEQAMETQGGEAVRCSVLHFLFLQSGVIQSSPGELASCPHQLQPSASHAHSLLGYPDCSAPSDLFCVILLNPLEGDEGREFFAFVHIALAERRPLQCRFAFALVTRGS